jgi:hypothetical protein
VQAFRRHQRQRNRRQQQPDAAILSGAQKQPAPVLTGQVSVKPEVAAKAQRILAIREAHQGYIDQNHKPTAVFNPHHLIWG